MKLSLSQITLYTVRLSVDTFSGAHGDNTLPPTTPYPTPTPPHPGLHHPPPLQPLLNLPYSTLLYPYTTYSLPNPYTNPPSTPVSISTFVTVTGNRQLFLCMFSQ